MDQISVRGKPLTIDHWARIQGSVAPSDASHSSLAKPSKPAARLRELLADAVEETRFDTDQQCPIPAIYK